MIIDLLLLAALGYALARYLGQKDARRAQGQARQAAPLIAATPIAACAVCGVHLPKVDTLTAEDGKAYCSEAHRSLGHVQPG